MKSPTKPALRVAPAAHGQLSLPIHGVLLDAKHAFGGLCINAGKQLLVALMEVDSISIQVWADGALYKLGMLYRRAARARC